MNFERVARLVALAGMIVLLWRTLRPAAVVLPMATATTAELPRALQRWTVTPPSAVRLRFDSIPGTAERGWIAALARAGTPFTWTADSTVGPTALSVEPARDPRGGARVRVLAARGSSLSARDDAGLIDSSRAGGVGTWGARVLVEGPVRVAGRGAVARTSLRDSIAVRPVLLVGRAGWESKFTVVALEEAGWRVDAKLLVAPEQNVWQGSAAPIDTSRYAAVVVLDATAAPIAARLAPYVQSGGGLIVAGAAADLPALAALLTARPAMPIRGVLGAIAGPAPRTGLAARALALRSASVVLERRATFPTVAAWRVGAGRVVQVGYDEIWRWRMMGDDDAPAAHRAWWSQLVAGVAYAPRFPLDTPGGRDETPWAATVAALGPPSTGTAMLEPPESSSSPDRWLFAIVLLALLTEWGSRRLRGAP